MRAYPRGEAVEGFRSIPRGSKYWSLLKESQLFSGRLGSIRADRNRGKTCLTSGPFKKTVEKERHVFCEGERRVAGLEWIVRGQVSRILKARPIGLSWGRVNSGS